ncbi:hypothetical protein [Paraburkholderia solisilvae]|uniref:Uncharacterized protein n=1 Tax=Paraburkholderia solisilvae TaxID=624376 RepID=A0A6J5DIF8_9BURK|nr:hypothetical protein [Paraburkholderia solisilvae]CAB3753031.1 hypothetical protein LMG29739_01647 [Paraburkholderia solisilvae]
MAIREHVARLGTVDGQRAARKLFPDVAKPTWDGWCRLVRLDAGPRGDLAETAFASAAGAGIPAHTPSIPLVAMRSFGFDQRIAMMDAGAAALFDAAWPVDPATGRRSRVKNPMLLKYAMAAMASTSAVVVRYEEAAWNTERVRDQYQEIGRVLGDVLAEAEDKELAGRLIAKLREADERFRNRERYMFNRTETEDAN